MAVRASIARVAEIDAAWTAVKVVARPVKTSAPAMPLTDWELMQGARERALAVREILVGQKLETDLYVGLEGGFHSISVEGEWHTFLRGWAFVTDGERGCFGATPSISVPESIRKNVIEGKRELGLVIDEVAGTRDVRVQTLLFAWAFGALLGSQVLLLVVLGEMAAPDRVPAHPLLVRAWAVAVPVALMLLMTRRAASRTTGPLELRPAVDGPR